MDKLSNMNTPIETPKKSKDLKPKKIDDLCSISEHTTSESLSRKLTTPLLNASIGKSTAKKSIDSTKKLKKKINELTEQNEKLTQKVNDQNQEIKDLKHSVNSLNDVLTSVPFDQLRTDNSAATNKILELSKKNRQYRMELESKRLLLNKRQTRIHQLEKDLSNLNETLKKDNGEAKKHGKCLAELQTKHNLLQQKWFEVRNKNAELQEKLKLANKCLQQEIGTSFDISKLNYFVMQNGGNWRGRAQQILNLQQTNTELKARINVLENMAEPCTNNISETIDGVSINGMLSQDQDIIYSQSLHSPTSGMRKVSILTQNRLKVEELEKINAELKTELETHRKKMFTLKIRNKNLYKNLIEWKTKAKSLEADGEYNGLNFATMNENFIEQTRQYENRLQLINKELKELKQSFETSKLREDELKAKLAKTEKSLTSRDKELIKAHEKIKTLEEDMKSICGEFLFSCRELRKEEFVAILDSLETEKNFLTERVKVLDQRLNEERTKYENLNDLLSKQKIINKNLETKIRQLEKEINTNTNVSKKTKRLQRITEHGSNLSAKSSFQSATVLETTSRTSFLKISNDENTMPINVDIQQKLELATEKIVLLENRLNCLNAEKEYDAKFYVNALEKSKNAILETISNYRGGNSHSNCISFHSFGGKT